MKSKSKPIIFSSEMVRATLEGRKTQHRIPIKDQLEFFGCCDDDKLDPSLWGYQDSDGYFYALQSKKGDNTYQIDSPWDYCNRLWVRETFADTVKLGIHAPNDELGGFVYKATDPDWSELEGFRWFSPVSMPKEACRLTLEIATIRPQRLQNISEEEAIAEGIRPLSNGLYYDYEDECFLQKKQ